MKTMLTASIVIAACSLPVPILPRASAQQGPSALAEAQGDEAMPIRRITLYRSGVGAFERQGMIEGEQRVQLRFKTDQVNDILKSMVLLDLDGGKVGAVRYGSKEPLERRLASFGVDISGNPSIAALFAQLRGSEVRVVTAEGEVRGTILGIENRPVPQPGPEGRTVSEPFVNLLGSGGIQSIAVSSIRTFSLTDEALAAELRRALEVVAEHRADRVKTVDLAFLGAPGKPRRVYVSYVQEMPVWKTTYRLVLADGKDDKGTPTIQGWAIVENTTEDDWDNVRLSLASGSPVAFTMDLYEPIFAHRPELPVPVLGGIFPRNYQAGIDRERFEAEEPAAPASPMERARTLSKASRAETADAAAQAGMGGRFEAEGLPPGALSDYLDTGESTGGEVGEQFMYTVDTPVSLERQRSAMIPLLTTGIEGRRLSIFTPGEGIKHPMRGAEIRNNTGLDLLPGPIAVYDGDTYAGDASILHTSRGQKRLLAYALDLDVFVLVKPEHQRILQRIAIVNGSLRHTMKALQTSKYDFKSYDEARARTILLEHPKMGGFDLVKPEKPAEETDALYRFEIAVEPAASASFEVVEERTYFETYAVTGFDLNTLLVYSQQGKASRAVVDAVRKASDLQAAVNTTEREIQELDQERNAITADQDRIRRNMGSIDRTSELYGRYMRTLTEQETRLESMHQRRQELVKRLETERRALEDYIRNLNVE